MKQKNAELKKWLLKEETCIRNWNGPEETKK
jgi:hypothetical protein